MFDCQAFLMRFCIKIDETSHDDAKFSDMIYYNSIQILIRRLNAS